MRRIIGIDPGVQGCIAHTDDGGSTFQWQRLYAKADKAKELDLDDAVRRVRELVNEVDGDAVVYLEEIITLRHDARANVLTAARRWGDLHRACRELGVEVITMQPRTWMARLGLRRLPRDKTARKRVLASEARRRCGLPRESRKLPVYLADGVLVAAYGAGDWKVRALARDAQEVR